MNFDKMLSEPAMRQELSNWIVTELDGVGTASELHKKLTDLMYKSYELGIESGLQLFHKEMKEIVEEDAKRANQ